MKCFSAVGQFGEVDSLRAAVNELSRAPTDYETGMPVILVLSNASLFPESVLLSQMAHTFNWGTFTRRGPDLITEELALVLSQKTTYEFNPLFDLVYANLLARNSGTGSEEQVRLRVYEKLQQLVGRGMVKKTTTKGVKKYRGLAALASTLPAVRGQN